VHSHVSFSPLICLDFDGVLHSYVSGWQGVARIPDPPVDGALDWLRDVHEAHAFGERPLRVAIHSSRSRSLRGRWAMQRWLRRNLWDHFGAMVGPRSWDPLAVEITDWVEWPWFKPPAMVTLDDRAVRFEGDWSAMDVDQLLAMKPWMKRWDGR
jgi:hypothetical protein